MLLMPVSRHLVLARLTALFSAFALLSNIELKFVKWLATIEIKQFLRLSRLAIFLVFICFPKHINFCFSTRRL